MNYTIMTTKSTYNNKAINLMKRGNKYVVGLYDEVSYELTTKTFDTIEDATSIYMKFVEAFAYGRNDYSMYKSWLA